MIDRLDVLVPSDTPDTPDEVIPPPAYFEWLQRRLRLSINRNLTNKVGEKAWHGKGFQPLALTIPELAAEIRAGHAYSYEYKTDRRSTETFIATDILSVDIDEGLTLDHAKDHELVKRCASLIFTTASHTDAAHRFRIVFALERTLTNADHVRAAARSLASRLCGDMRATDPARLCYGNTDAIVEVYNRGLTAKDIDQLVNQTINVVGDVRPRGVVATNRSKLTASRDLRLVGKYGRVGPIGDFDNGAPVHCPYHADNHPSAVVYVNGGNRRCIHCFACGQTFWVKPAHSELPSAIFDRAVLGNTAWGIEAEKSVFSDEFISDLPLGDGLNFIKSPKGSGKTELLTRAIPKTASVLLVGHRKALLRHMCKRLELDCYLDKPGNRSKSANRRFGVSLDSLTKHRLLSAYDFIVLDESEQVLAHFLADTIGEKRHHSLRKLMQVLGSAATVVALDADLSMLSFDFISRWSQRSGVEKRKRIFFNSFSKKRGEIQIFSTREQITGDLLQSLKSGKRCFVASNSKRYVQSVDHYIQSNLPAIKRIAITSDTTKIADDPAGRFVYDPVTESLRYQLVLTTPAVSSGVDITFDENQAYFDCVYGVFENEPTDHFECDQQLSRVRNPGEVKVFISPEISFSETDPQVVQQDLRRSDVFGYLAPDQDEGDDELFKLAIAVYVSKRTSKNRLKEHFLQHKDEQGWSANKVQSDSEVTREGKVALSVGRVDATNNLVERLMSASQLSPSDAKYLSDQQRRDGGISRRERDQLHRAEIESFYRRPIFADLILESENGNWRPKIRMFEHLIQNQGFELEQELFDMRGLSRQALVSARADVQRWLLRQALELTPLYKQGSFNAQVRFCGEDLMAFKSFVVKNRSVFNLQFKHNIRGDIESSPMKQLSAFIDLMHLKLEKAGTQPLGDQKTYFYRLNPRRLRGMETLAQIRRDQPPLHECLEDR